MPIILNTFICRPLWMKKFKMIRNIRENGQKLDQSIQMRQNSQMSSDCTASYICSVQSSLCVDNHSFVSDQAGFVSDQVGFVSDQAGFVSDQAGFVSDQTGFVSEQTGLIHQRTLKADDN